MTISVIIWKSNRLNFCHWYETFSDVFSIGKVSPLVWRSSQRSRGWNHPSTSRRWYGHARYSNHVDERCTSTASSTFESQLSPLSRWTRRGCFPLHWQSEYVSKLVKTVGIVIAASSIRTKASHIAVQCRSCRNVITNIKVKPGLEGYAMPRKCTSV